MTKEQAAGKIRELLKEFDMWFVAGGGYHHIRNCDIVGGKILVAQQPIPKKI